MGAPGGGLKQCAQGWGQDRTSVGSPHMPKATFPFVTARQWVDGWRLFFIIKKYSDCISGPLPLNHSDPCHMPRPVDHPGPEVRTEL
eukprot:SAG25_NODE_868_length_5003_cov_2.755914_5_plen_87_part_00